MGKTVLITGCSSGIGRALAFEFQRRGHSVWASARKIESLNELKEKGMHVLALDVTDPNSIQNAANQLERESGKLDVLVNNAGYACIGPVAELPLTALRAQFETNVLGQIALTQAMLPLLRHASGAQIVNLGSVSGILTTPFAGAYCASKAALHLLSDALRMELAPFKILVITVQPGAIESNFGQRAQSGLPVNLPTESWYTPVRANIEARANASQENPTPTQVFAQDLVRELEKPRPKIIIRLGRGCRVLPALKRWLPERLLDQILSKKFGLNRLKS